jgi:long-chain fatty acid transport protein
MKIFTRTALAAAGVVAGLGTCSVAWATNGYFPHGYGIKAKGMGGVATATAEDALGGATNPAKMAFVGSRMDLGLEWFSPHRDATRSGAAIPSLNGTVDSGKTGFLVPEFGYNQMLSPQLALGVTVYGNGGMNTTYPQGNFNCGAGAANMLCGGGELGVDLMQLVVAPTVAWKPAPNHAIGASVLLGYQRFKAFGLHAFDNAPGFPPFTGAPGSVTNQGSDSATGAGLRIGYQGRLNNQFSVGVAYSSKVDMGRLSKYKGLFADAGDFDIPSNYSVGVAFDPVPGWTIAADWQRINYSDVKSVNNASAPAAPLGAVNGPGFGWRDVEVFKLGAAWRASDSLTLRAGYNRGTNPINAADVTFNILAPGVITEHYTLGASWARDAKDEFNAFLMVAPRQSVSGGSLFNGLFPAPPNAGGTETISMRQFSIGLGWSRKF